MDIENLVGYGKFPAGEVRRVRDLYRLATTLKIDDLVIIASGPQNKRAIYEGWSDAMYLWRRGENGADLALVDFFATLSDLSPYGHLFIGSGDKKLAEVANAALLAGLPATIVARRSSLSAQFAMHKFINLNSATSHSNNSLKGNLK